MVDYARALASALAAALGLSLLPGAVRAADPPLTPLPYDLAVDGAVTGAAAAAALALEFLLKDDLAPRACAWCQPGPIDGPLSRSVAWSDPRAADAGSTVLALALPAGLLGYGLVQAYRLGDPAAGWADALLVVEAGSLAMLANETVKYLVARSRPYVWQGRPGPYGDPLEQNLSFFSGHATLAFGAAVSAGTIFLMEDMPGAPVALGVGLGAAAVVGYLRMAADKHYLTDVLAGAAVGSLVGWAVPYFFHRPGKKATEPGAVRLVPGELAVAW